MSGKAETSTERDVERNTSSDEQSFQRRQSPNRVIVESYMPKPNIHPTYYPEATISCSCGATYKIGSTRESLKVDICRTCHPFYSGNQKLIDTAGRVDRFREKVAAAEARKTAKPAK